MKIWLDDIRTPPTNDWVWCKNAKDAIDLIEKGNVNEISFDHDLGDDVLNGNNVARRIEELAFGNEIKRIDWQIHSANPVGRSNILSAMTSADKFWTANEEGEK